MDENEEERRRAALLGMGLLLPEQLANLPIAGPPPIIAGTPQIAQVPVIPNTLPPSFSPAPPAIQAAPPGITPFQAQIQPPQALSASPPIQAGQYSSAPAHHSNPFGHHQSNPPHHLPKPRHRLYPRRFPGCLAIIAVFLAALVAIIGTSLALATTHFAPGLSISGNANVAPGGVLILHGHNFSSNSNVTLTFDNNVPVLLISQALTLPSRSASQGLDSSMLALSSFQMHTTPNMISTHSDGTFNVTIQIEQAWAPGHHTIHATEVTSQRNASLPFTITQATATDTPTTIATDTPTATPTPSPTPTAIPTSTPTPRPTPTTAPPQPPVLSCATPGNLSLGPINASSSQPTSANVTLCSRGSGTLTWKASWNQNTATWLQIPQSSGSVQAPHSTQLTIRASAAELTAGTYATTITFTGIESNTTQKVNIILTVQSPPPPPPTISVSPTSVDANAAPCDNSRGGDSGGGDSICTITLTNNSSTNALDWSWSATGNGSVQANSTTIAAGGTETVYIYIPYGDCGTQITVTFSAPGNTASVTWNCTPPTPTPTPMPTPMPTPLPSSPPIH